MAEEKWQQIRSVFDEALTRPPSERQEFVRQACGEDKILLREVESLLISLDNAENFLETPIAAKVADALTIDKKKALESGKCFGHYEIIEQIGSGGMGEIYLALDKKLDRKVAIKILNEKFSRDSSNLKRFIHEAKSASALNHPNILVIHEIGQYEDIHYIACEYVKGKTLRELLKESSLKLSEILDISIQIAAALGAAHEAHLVHRDLKPENIMVRPDEFVKILDFGLAKLIQEQQNKIFPELNKSNGEHNQTTQGIILGTVNYMSPEQATAERIDERTDIFSLGVVIYEMIAGRAPFAGESFAETFANLLNQEPLSLTHFAANVPDKLQKIVSKMLRKPKDERYQTMKEVLVDLKDLRDELSLEENLQRFNGSGKNARLTARVTDANEKKQSSQINHDFSQRISQRKLTLAFAIAALLVGAAGFAYYFSRAGKATSNANDKKSIAVLPLKPINTANRDEIYEIGIADSLIHHLGLMNGLIVRPLSAIRKYADIEQDPIAAGKEQQVDYILASNYQLADGRIRVTAQLMNVATGQIEETKIIEKDSANIFAMQDAVAGEIGNILLKHFATTSSNTKLRRGTDNVEAYRLYLQGMYLYSKRTPRASQKSVELLDQAVRLDPNYALAWAGKAHAHRFRGNLGRDTNTHEEYQNSIRAVKEALLLDKDLSEAYSALCENKYYYEWDFAGAETECRRALALDPNSSLAHEIYGRFLFGRGRFDEAIGEIKTAIALDPTSLLNQRNLGIALYYAGHYDEAAAQFKKVIETDEDFSSAYMWLRNALEMQEKYPEAFEWFIKSQRVFGADEGTIQLYKTLYQISGYQYVLREYVKKFDKNSINQYYIGAILNAQTGDKEKAFEYLEKSYQRREWGMNTLLVEPLLGSLRSDPRFDDLVRRVESK